jgi:hypothetical protein
MLLDRNKKVGLWLVMLITLGAVVALLNHGPIPQPLSYHGFVDRRVIWGIPNFFDVLSNLPFVLVGFNSVFTKVSSYWLLLSAYVIAKLCEHFDREIYAASGFVSGHTLKHVVAAIGIYILLLSFDRRRCT